MNQKIYLGGVIVVLLVLASIVFVFTSSQPEGKPPLVGGDCGSVAPEGRDECCAKKNEDTAHIMCVGRWRYNGGEGVCEYICLENGVRERKPETPNNSDADEHGCLTEAGYVWCDSKKKCLRVWEEDCSGLGEASFQMKSHEIAAGVAQNYVENQEYTVGRVEGFDALSVQELECIGCYDVYVRYFIVSDNKVEMVEAKVMLNQLRVQKLVQDEEEFMPSTLCNKSGGTTKKLGGCDFEQEHVGLVGAPHSKKSCCVAGAGAPPERLNQ